MGQCEGMGLGSDSLGAMEAQIQVNTMMGRYRKMKVLGEGSACICHKCEDQKTGQAVAAKVYRDPDLPSMQQKFLQQVKTLKALSQPLQQPADTSLWSPEMVDARPEELFIQMLDYSKTYAGEPGPSPVDRELLVVCELGEYSLKDAIQKQRKHQQHFPKDVVRQMAHDIVRGVAGLHAKGFVHLDFKPENIMMCNGRLKLIDVDGCRQVDEMLHVKDRSLAFSPVYCAPEWARFVAAEEKEDETIRVRPSLDAWSVGMTLIELVTLYILLAGKFDKSLSKNRFLKWLGGVGSMEMPESVAEFDPEFKALILCLVCKVDARRPLCQCLRHPFFTNNDH